MEPTAISELDGLVSRGQRFPGWRLALAAGPLAGFVVLLYWNIVRGMVAFWWTDAGSSHGFLVVPLAIYVAWQQRGQTLGERAETDYRGMLAISFACLLYLAGRLGAELFLKRFSLVVLIAGLVFTFWGVRRLRRLAFPLLLLATMVPLPTLVYYRAAGPLQLVASDVASRLAQALGVVVFRDGNIIHLASTSLGVAEACSGLRSITSLTIAALLLAYLYCSRRIGWIILLLLAIPTAIAVNVFRVSVTAVLADYDPDLASGFFHFFEGWLVFTMGFGILFLEAKILARLLNRIPPPSSQERSP